MSYKYINELIDKNNLILPVSDKINEYLHKNNYKEITKAVDFLASDEKFLYIHGFLGTGKRQLINYVLEFLSKDVIKLEYYCKESTVCDDILLNFIDNIESKPISNAININGKISTLLNKFSQFVSSIRKPFIVVLHSIDVVQESNLSLIIDLVKFLHKCENVKLIISSKAMQINSDDCPDEDRKIFLRAFSKPIFKELITSSNINCSDTVIDDFYKYTRGYYYYTVLSIKIIQSMKISLSEFLAKFNNSGMSFDLFLGITYLNLVPNIIRNFFWFLRTIRHGLTLNALAVLELYDEFSIEYLKANHMIFVTNDTLYVQDYFLQNIDISIPAKTEIKLHKYIISIYENQLRESLKTRYILISRQALRAEIEYHNQRIEYIENGENAKQNVEENKNVEPKKEVKIEELVEKDELTILLKQAIELENSKKYTDAIELFQKLNQSLDVNLTTLIEARLHLAKLYSQIENYSLAVHFYELVETYYTQHKEVINLNYLYYSMAEMYYKMFNRDKAIEIIKKVIYSVDTPRSLMVEACTLLGNIYSELNNYAESFLYYQKAIDSVDSSVEKGNLAELYFKYAYANDEHGNEDVAFEYYTKCISFDDKNPYKALAYSNLAACYYDNNNLSEALDCYQKAYDIEKFNNNYEGIYYTSIKIGHVYNKLGSHKALSYFLEAKKSAEFINEEFYILESLLALGDYYYNIPSKMKECLIEYVKARKIANNLNSINNINVINERIVDMRLRMPKELFEEIIHQYGELE